MFDTEKAAALAITREEECNLQELIAKATSA
jgi:hypothetical protein